ncbi:response regulator transcription factor [Brevibacterium yomogidense]|uniref:response regulator transcription factor n=1 Tax=Brevibacterium yomogidense TaxID=946573 RepID=UPI0018DF5A4C|nr:response regulator transcription factor [Brevibacterium yomogidense]
MPSDQSIRVLVVDDDHLVCTGLTHILSTADDIAVVGSAANGAEALESVMRHFPDVVLMDIQMPVMDGIEATRRITNMPRPPQVVALTSFDAEDYVFRALEAGAAGYILKDIAPDDLKEAVRTIHGGDGFVSPRATTGLIRAHRVAQTSTRRFDAVERLSLLTAREREMAILVAQGMSTRDIAEATYASEATVKTHLGRIMTRTDAPNRVGVAVLVALAGLLD